MSTATDTYEFVITIIEHGNAEILNVVVPTTPIYTNTPFEIKYDVKNTSGSPDVLYGKILDEDGETITGTYWEETITPGESITKTYSHPGFETIGQYTLTIEAGRP